MATRQFIEDVKRAHWKEVEIVGLPEVSTLVKFYQCTNCGIIHRGTYLNGLHCERCKSYMG